MLCCPIMSRLHLQNVQRVNFRSSKGPDHEPAIYKIEMRDGDQCGEVLARVTSPFTDSGVIYAVAYPSTRTAQSKERMPRWVKRKAVAYLASAAFCFSATLGFYYCRSWVARSRYEGRVSFQNRSAEMSSIRGSFLTNTRNEVR